MALNIKLMYTNPTGSGQSQSNPNASLGGYASTTEVSSSTSLNNLFADTTWNQIVNGSQEYRFLDIYNAGDVDSNGIMFYFDMPVGSYAELALGYDAGNQPHSSTWNGEVLSDGETAPSSPSMTFSSPGEMAPKDLLHINDAVFDGSGLDDLAASGTYSGTTESELLVRIDGTGTVDTFRWSNDGGSTWEATGVSITGSAQLLENGVYITFNAVTGHTLNDEWTITCDSTLPIGKYIRICIRRTIDESSQNTPTTDYGYIHIVSKA